MAPVINGQIGSGVLVSVGGGQALRADAAAAWLAVVAEVRAQFGIVLRLTDSYRPYAVQVRIFNERYDPASSGSGPFGDVRWWGGVRFVRMRGASAAVPGTSNHGLGVAVDVTGLGGFGGSAYARLAAVAPAHGWSNASGRKINEPWHWEYTPVADTHPTPAPAQEDDMPTLQEIDAVVRVAVADEVAKVMRGNEFELEVTSLPQAIAAAVLGAQITRSGLGPAALADWIADGRILAGQAAERATGGATGAIDYAALAKAVNDDAARRLAS